MSNFLTKSINIIFTFFIVFILSASIVEFSNWIATGMLSIIISLLIVSMLILFFYFGNNIINLIRNLLTNVVSNLSTLKMGLILFFTVLLTKIFFVFLFDIDANLHPDMKNYLSFATQIANDGVITENVSAALKWPYEVIFGLFLSPVIKLFGNDTQVATSYLSLCFAVSSVLLFDIIKKYIGKNFAFVGLMIFNLLPVGLFETQLLVHENALIFFYILSFWLLHRALEYEYKLFTKTLLICLSAILISFGNKINQGGTVVIISYCIYSVIILFRDSFTIKRFIKATAVIMCYVVAFIGISSCCNVYVNNTVDISAYDYADKESYTVPLGWGIYLGSNYEHSGVWNQEDADTYNKYFDLNNKEEAQEYQKNLINERLQLYKDSPLLVIPHFFNKLKALWGRPFLPFAYEQGNSINDFVVHGFGGIVNKIFIALAYLSFILICTINLLSFKFTRKKYSYTPVIQFELMIIGLTMVLILFEVTPKYVSYLQIIMFCIALFKYKDFLDNANIFHKALAHKRLHN